MVYKCIQCASENVAQESTQLWHLNQREFVKNSRYDMDFFWCFDCDDEVEVKEEDD